MCPGVSRTVSFVSPSSTTSPSAIIRSTVTGVNDSRPPKCGSLNPPSSSTGASPTVAHISAPVSCLISASAAVWSQCACICNRISMSSNLEAERFDVRADQRGRVLQPGVDQDVAIVRCDQEHGQARRSRPRRGCPITRLSPGTAASTLRSGREAREQRRVGGRRQRRGGAD